MLYQQITQQIHKVETFFKESHPFKLAKKSINNNRIFVNIASYRDPETPKTVKNILETAEHPELLRIIVYEQNDPNDPKVEKHPSVTIFHDHYTKAKGPVWARYLIQQFYDQEEYYLQIDAHSRFVKNWDTKLKHMLRLLPDKSVLTQYPPIYSIKDGSFDIHQIRTGLYIQGFGIVDKMTRVQSDIIVSKPKVNYPFTNKGWAACFSFSKGDIVKDAPYDPWLPFLFFGEELDITLRLYTRGWNFFSPHENIIFTCFTRTHRRTFWQDLEYFNRKSFEIVSRKRLCNRLNITFKPENIIADFLLNQLDLSIYSMNKPEFQLGTERTLEDYQKFAQITSINEQKLDPKAKTFRRKSDRILLT